MGKNKFEQGLLWNYLSVGFLAVGGFIFSTIIMVFYDAEVLGVFNRVYAYYIVLSQIAVWGIHMSVVRYVSEKATDKDKVKIIFSTAMILVVFISIAIILCIIIIQYFLSMDMMFKKGIYCILPALCFFSMNKVITSLMNGMSHMKWYAIIQSARNIFIAIGILIVSFTRADGGFLPISFSIAEFLILLIELRYLFKNSLFSLRVSLYWIKTHFLFGTKILPANFILELNTKIDIICIGFLTNNNSLVGIYSFAALFAEGFYQLAVVIRRSINPLITQKYFKKELSKKEFGKMRTIIKFSVPVALVVDCVIVAFVSCLCKIPKFYEYGVGIGPLFILCTGIALNYRGIIMGNSLSQTGFPLEESIVNLFSAAVNFVLNLILIYYWACGERLWQQLVHILFTHLY